MSAWLALLPTILQQLLTLLLWLPHRAMSESAVQSAFLAVREVGWALDLEALWMAKVSESPLEWGSETALE